MENLKELLTCRILSIPGVTKQYLATDNGGLTSFSFNGKDFAHYHTGNELDLRLTKKVIASEKLVHPRDSTVHPNRSQNSPWIELRFNSKAEVAVVHHLVALSIKQL